MKLLDEHLYGYLRTPEAMKPETVIEVCAELLELRQSRKDLTERTIQLMEENKVCAELIGLRAENARLAEKIIDAWRRRHEANCRNGLHNFPVANGAVGDTCIHCGVKRE